MEALEKKKPNGSDLVLTAPQADTLLTVIERAVMSPDFDVAKLGQLLELRERYEANEARKSFVVSMNAFKQNPPRILKNKQADAGAYKYLYATLDAVCDAIIGGLSAVGISHRWETNQDGGAISVTCILTHEAGHSERTTLKAAPDTSGGKNPIQAVGSAVSYLQRYTLFAATGLAATNSDTDGHTASPKGGEISEERFCQLHDFIQNAKDRAELEKYYQMAMGEAAAKKDENSQRAFAAAKNKWLKENSRVSR